MKFAIKLTILIIALFAIATNSKRVQRVTAKKQWEHTDGFLSSLKWIEAKINKVDVTA